MRNAEWWCGAQNFKAPLHKRFSGNRNGLSHSDDACGLKVHGFMVRARTLTDTPTKIRDFINQPIEKIVILLYPEPSNHL